MQLLRLLCGGPDLAAAVYFHKGVALAVCGVIEGQEGDNRQADGASAAVRAAAAAAAMAVATVAVALHTLSVTFPPAQRIHLQRRGGLGFSI